MKFKTLLTFSAISLLYSTQHNAQVSAYTFTQSLSTYGTTNIGTIVGNSGQDDDITTVTLPFTFIFNGIAQANVYVSSNGYLSFNVGDDGSSYNALSDASTNNLIAPFSADLIQGFITFGEVTVGSNTITNCSSVAGLNVGDVFFDDNTYFNSDPTIVSITGNSVVVDENAIFDVTQAYFFNPNGFIKQNISGIAPNRICEFEFKNYSRYTAIDEILNFKVRLYETSNKIEFIYGSMIVDIEDTPLEVGLKGATDADYSSRKITLATNTWSNSVASTTIIDVCDFDNTIFPASGQSYMWSPGAVVTGFNTLANIENLGISTYPNPVNEYLHVRNSSEKEVPIFISDVLGKQVYSTSVKAQSTEVISSEFLHNGIYFISAMGSNGTVTKKIIKE